MFDLYASGAEGAHRPGKPVALPLLLSLACSSEPENRCALLDDLQVEVAEPGTVLEIHAETRPAGQVTVEGVHTDLCEVLDRPPITAEGEEHHLRVLGLPPFSAVEVELLVEVGERSCRLSVEEETSGLPVIVPEPELVLGDARFGEDGWIATSVASDEGMSSVLMALDGTVVWVDEDFAGLRTVVSADRKSVVLNQAARTVDETGTIVTVPFDGSEPATIQAPGLHTDFVEIGDGEYGALQWRVHKENGLALLSSDLVQISEGGSRRLWSAEEDFAVLDADSYDDSTVGGDAWPELLEWTHVNGLSYDEASDAFLVTEAYNHAVVRVGRETGSGPGWVLGGPASDYRLEPEGFIVSPHSARFIGLDELLVFSRGDIFDDTEDACAWVSRVHLDRDAGVAREVERYSGRDCNRVSFFGEAAGRPEGGMFILWSSAGRIEEIDAEQKTRYLLEMGLGAAFAYGQRVDTIYR